MHCVATVSDDPWNSTTNGMQRLVEGRLHFFRVSGKWRALARAALRWRAILERVATSDGSSVSVSTSQKTSVLARALEDVAAEKRVDEMFSQMLGEEQAKLRIG